ncbi:uncharacterized protein ACWYII_032349 isoform 2-T2 [Salvelinus alpinus]
MPKLTLIGLYFWICLAQKVVSGDDRYHKVGGELVLTPDKSTVPDSITSILWKHGKDKVAEWDNDFGGLEIYAAFKDRTTLNQNTGELRISGLKTTDSGVYSVEVNSKLLDKTYKRTVIKAVPKPTIISSCNTNKTSCILTCEGDTTDAEPVTYSWKVGEGAWEVVDKQRNVSKNDTGKSTNGYKYTCKLKNTVSGEGEVSEPVGEVFGSEYLYHEVEGELLLKPDKSTVPNSNTSIIWKHGKNKVAEWDNNFGGLEIYGAFIGRTTLNQTTGELRISGLMTTDSGVYSVEFNSKLLDKTYKLSVIKAVPEPTITSSCNPDKTSCTLTCEGDTTDAEPVTYSWKVGEGVWEVGGKLFNVFKSDTGKSTNGYKYICKMKNSVSGEVSEPVGEVFGSEPSNTGAIVVVFIIVALVAIAITGFLLWKKKTGYPQNTWIYFLRKYFGGMFAKGSAGVQPEQGKGNADKAEKGNEDLNLKVGGELLLTPDKSTVPNPITSILWKHGNNKVAEWDKDFGGLDIYAAFKGRTTLDQTTGELRISGLMKTDSGVYSVEFNSNLLDKTYKLSVIKAVPKPTITSSCNPDKTSCTLTCEGDTTDAEPVTYSWKVGEGAWEVVDKQLIVFKNDTGKSTNSYKYICKLNNSVSEEVSEPVGEVFVSDLYHKVEGELVLTPDKSTVPDPITSILWKHGKNKVAEWDNDFGLDIYAAFKERTTLDQTTGELRISGLMKTDSGVYSVEFNSKLLDKTYTMSVIKAVPIPTITSSCNANLTSCTLTCEGNTTDGEPVTYSWKEEEGPWVVGGKLLIVSKSDTGNSTNSYKYICKLNNSVSGEVSEPVGEVFGSEPSIRDVVGVVVTATSNLLDKTYKLSVIKAVPKPTITYSCNPDKTSCTLTCEGNTTDAEPVTYSWKVGEGAWEVVDKQLIVFKNDTGKSTNSYKYICKLNNSVSGEFSEPVGEVFVSEYLYHKVGGELVLTPDKSTVPDPITSILWKHGKNKVAEWYKDYGLDIYGAFKERTTLDQTTGELRISGLMKTDSGGYSVEVNSKLLDKTYKLSVIKAVPKPTITSSCNANLTSCTLTCEGNTTDAEPVTYSWKEEEGPWVVGGKLLIVSKSDTGNSTNSYKYICKLNNSVSGEVSEPVGEVFGSEYLYLKVGGELVLKPDKSTVPDSITSIVWKHGKNKVAYWDNDFGGLDIYGAFKERTTLDQTTGELRISGLMTTDSGVYSVEFNSKLDQTYKLSVIKAVPKPTITSSCNPDKTSCTLTCEGDTTDAEPVTYSWKVGEGAWEVLDKQLIFSKSNTDKSNSGYKYTCKLKNIVSGEVSEPVGEVFGSEYLYHEVGGELVLTPDKSTVPDSITSIVWKHGKYKVAEWDNDFGGLDIYAAFKDRTTLDQTTGELRISGLMKTDSGVYSVEFNSKLDQTYKLSVIKAVPKPTITSSCNPDKNSCTLTCEGDTTDAEPVTYSWKVGEGAWEVLDKQLIFSKSNTDKSNSGYKYTCKLKNIVSGEVSEPVGEVFGSEYLYHEVGGELVLTPDKSTVPDSITSIVWKHGKYKVAEWDNDFGGLDIYAAFKDRTTLDQTTGELRISGLMKTDSGVYSVEFNSKLDQTYKLSVIKAVPKPTITSSCNPDKTSCTLTCEGDTTDAEPVTYSWKVGEGAWEVLDKQLIFSKSDTGKSNSGYKYTCKLKNVVSGEVSEPVGEVFGSEYLYLEVGGELVLTPDKSTVPDSITSILWKHGKYKVAEWDKDFGGLDIYAAFKERTTLDQTTGELRISGLKKTDSGVYSVEFNSKLLDKTYKLSVIKAVPKPTITSSCNPDKTSCTLTCEGDTTDAEPVTYSWKVGEGAWEVLDKQLIFSKSNTGKSNSGYNYICKLKNAVSGEASEPVGELFGSEGNHEEELGVGKGEADKAAEKT